MHVTVETIEGAERRMRVEIPEKAIAGKTEERLRDLKKNANISGFRVGKAPMKLLVSRFGQAARNEVVGEMLESTFKDALAQEKLTLAGNPTVDTVDANPGEGLTFVTSFEVLPEIALPPPDTLEIKRPVATLAEEDVDRMMASLFERCRIWREVTRPAMEGDRMTVDVDLEIDGERQASAEQRSSALTLEGEYLLPGFKEGLIGANPGEERVLNLTFPDSYHKREAAGKTGVFTIKIHALEESSPPQTDAEAAKEYGIEDGDVRAYRKAVREDMERKLREALGRRARKGVIDALLEKIPMTLPRTLVTLESERIEARRREQLRFFGVNPDGVPDDDKTSEESLTRVARDRVATRLIFEAIVKAQALTLDEDRVEKWIENLAEGYEDPRVFVNWYRQDNERLSRAMGEVLDEQIIEWVLEHADVEDVPTTFSALMDTDAPGAASSADEGADTDTDPGTGSVPEIASSSTPDNRPSDPQSDGRAP